jgi:hypothetical protein
MGEIKFYQNFYLALTGYYFQSGVKKASVPQQAPTLQTEE